MGGALRRPRGNGVLLLRLRSLRLASEGTLYYQATAMTMAGIVMGQVGAGLGWRTNIRSTVSIGLLSNQLLVV